MRVPYRPTAGADQPPAPCHLHPPLRRREPFGCPATDPFDPGPSPWLVAVESLGGMGKTALADALCRMLVRQGAIPALAWVTAQKQQLSLGGIIRSVEHPALTSAELVQVLAQQLLADEPDYPALSLACKEERLAQRFQTASYLVVVDNLETLADVEALLGHLRSWANSDQISAHHPAQPPGRSRHLSLCPARIDLDRCPGTGAPRGSTA